MKLRIVNYHALASVIKSEIEKITGKSTTVNTLVVAIKRYSDTLKEENRKLPPIDVLKDATITLTSDVADVTMRPKKSEFSGILKKIVEISSQLDETPDLFKSSNLIKLVAGEKEYKALIRTGLAKAHVVKEMMGLSKLTLHLSPLAKKNSGFAVFLSELLYRDGIDVTYSHIDEDTVLLVNNGDGPRAYEILQREIFRSKESRMKTKRRYQS
ncbi:MAG: hypothetical protein ACYC7D_09755 [Nitrososphaerales archaeon]